jgi:hypothetical protein
LNLTQEIYFFKIFLIKKKEKIYWKINIAPQP